MKRIFMFLSILFVFSSFHNTVEEVEARACNTGSYQKMEWEEKTQTLADGTKVPYKVPSGTITCAPLDEDGNVNESQLTKELKTLSDGSDLSAQPWTYKFGRMMIEFSVIVSYATQVLALITIAYSSYLYTTSEGDVRKIRQAKMLIVYAFIGMFISSFALVIANLLGGAI